MVEDKERISICVHDTAADYRYEMSLMYFKLWNELSTLYLKDCLYDERIKASSVLVWFSLAFEKHAVVSHHQKKKKRKKSLPF